MMELVLFRGSVLGLRPLEELVMSRPWLHAWEAHILAKRALCSLNQISLVNAFVNLYMYMIIIKCLHQIDLCG